MNTLKKHSTIQKSESNANIFKITGNVDLETVNDLAASAKKIIPEGQPVEFDFEQVQHCDSAAAAWLCEIKRHTQSDVTVINAPQQLIDISAVTGIQSFFSIS